MTRGAETKQKTARRFVGRVTLVMAFFAVFASSLVARAVYLQVLDKDFLNRQADTRHLRTEAISAHRGTILDRNGEPLAISTPVDTRSMGKEFLYLKRHLNPSDAQRVMAMKLPGINVQREYRRYYPASEVTGHLVGFTNIDDEGQEGLELAMNYWLEGEPGAKRVLKDRRGRSIENVESIRPPHHGKELRTSIDLRLQYLAYRTLKAAVITGTGRSQIFSSPAPVLSL